MAGRGGGSRVGAEVESTAGVVDVAERAGDMALEVAGV
jgi:hypothetical protein